MQRHGGALPLEHPRVSNELDRVTRALFGVQQDHLSRDWSAIPSRLGQGAAGRPGLLPSPLVLLPTLAEPPLKQPQQRTICMRLGVAGINRQSFRITPLSLVEARHFHAKIPEVIPGNRVVWFLGQGGPIAAFGLFNSATRPQ